MTVRSIGNNGTIEWSVDELTNTNFGDKRLTDRFIKLVSGLSQQSEASIPTALDTWSEACAAYRFLSNKKVTADKIFSGHKQATLARIKNEKIVLLPQVTTYSSLRGTKQTRGS